ncbi:MAG: SurA N-terminal domain-containing protein [SAR202 cluster bacterium]|nr:SurA N-terminal domain-containing protein [SAR202 cluster bacterium]
MVDDAGNAPSNEPVKNEPVRVDRRRLAVEASVGNRRRQRLAFGIIGVFLLVIVGIIVAGYAIIFVFPPQQLVVRVNDVEYTRGDMVKLLRLRQATLESLGQTFNSSDDVFEALQIIVENEIIAQSVSKLGLSVTTEELDDRVRGIMAPTADEAQGKSEDQIEREFQERYRQYLNTTQVAESEHRALVQRALLREKVRQLVGDKVPTLGEQVYVHRIIMGNQDEIDIMQTNLADALGDDKSSEAIQVIFKLVARDFSSDPDTVQNGGELGWIPRGVDEDYERAFFDLEIGELSEPIPNIDNPQQLFFFMLSDRAESREISESSRDILKTSALQIWLNEERVNHDVYAVFNSEIYGWILDELRISSTITPTAVPDSPFGGIPGF